jgi:NADPH:quinone reductase
MKAISIRAVWRACEGSCGSGAPYSRTWEGEVRVRILASPVNPSDLLFVPGHYAGVQPHFRSPAGFEGVGISTSATSTA